MFYQMGGETYGKWLVSAVLTLGSIICWFQANKYQKQYKIAKEQFKN
jgi:hypothetical protein